MERAVDMVARECGLETAEVKRKNLVKELPYTSATGEYFDSGDFIKVWDNLMAQADLAKFRQEQAEARQQGRYIGIGFGLGVELSGVASELLVPMENQPGYGAATVRLDPRGKVQVFEGDAPGGQGHETTGCSSGGASIRDPPQRYRGDDWRYRHHTVWIRHHRRARGFLFRQRRV